LVSFFTGFCTAKALELVDPCDIQRTAAIIDIQGNLLREGQAFQTKTLSQSDVDDGFNSSRSAATAVATGSGAKFDHHNGNMLVTEQNNEVPEGIVQQQQQQQPAPHPVTSATPLSASMKGSERKRCAFCDSIARADNHTAPESFINYTALWDHVWTPLTTMPMIRRSRKNIGNVGRLQHFLKKLCRGESTNILLIGGSNCVGAQLRSTAPRFPGLIENWLNTVFPVHNGTRKHRVHNRGAGGCGACVFSSNLPSYYEMASPQPIDVILTEFSVNDGLEGLPPDNPEHRQSRLCFEALVRTAFAHSPHLAIVPIELANQQTLFNGVASHHDISSFYGLPVISWRDAIFLDMRSGIGPKFDGLEAAGENPMAILKSSNFSDDGYDNPSLWVDHRHLNVWSHGVVLDAFVYLIQKELSQSEIVEPGKPPTAWLPYETTKWGEDKLLRTQRGHNTISGPIALVEAEGPSFYRSTVVKTGCDPNLHWSYTSLRPEQYRTDSKYKTEEQFKRMCNFEPITKTANFSFYEDRPNKPGWISNASTPQRITFEVPLPRLPNRELGYKHYSIRLGYLRSYENMCRFTVSLDGLNESKTLDGFWDRPRSTNEETEVGIVTRGVNVTVTTHPDIANHKTKTKIVWIRAVGTKS